MDPTEALTELRARTFYAQAHRDDGLEFPDVDTEENYARIVELILALDAWLTHGGFLPSQWTQTRISGW